MKKFEFKLETLLKLRQMKEKKTKFELGEILNQIHNVKDSIAKMNSDIAESYEAYELFLKSPSSGQMLQFFPEFVKSKKAHIEAKENYLYSLEKKYQLKITELTHKKAEVKIIENLKDKEQESYNKIKIRKEREQLEEFVSIKHFVDRRDGNEK